MAHHDLDVYPIPNESAPLYINEPWLVDLTLLAAEGLSKEPEKEIDNIRIYLPMDINKRAVLRRLDSIIDKYGAASEANEMRYSLEVDSVVAQLEIYDQINYVRSVPSSGDHSLQAVGLAGDMITRLEAIPDAGAERFPRELITKLKQQYNQ